MGPTIFILQNIRYLCGGRSQHEPWKKNQTPACIRRPSRNGTDIVGSNFIEHIASGAEDHRRTPFRQDRDPFAVKIKNQAERFSGVNSRSEGRYGRHQGGGAAPRPEPTQNDRRRHRQSDRRGIRQAG